MTRSARSQRMASGSLRRLPGAFAACTAIAALALASLSIRAASNGALPRSTPESQGVSSAALLDFVKSADRDIDAMHSVMVVRHGQVVAEGWWAPYAADVPHTLYSLTKSFTSTAIGLTIADGKLSLDDPVLKFFPGEAPGDPSAFLRAMRVRDLLTMSTGHHKEPELQGRTEWARTFLATPPDHKPGTFFLYNTPSTYMLSAIVQKVTGMQTAEYLRPRLFEPLGIDTPTWETSPENVTIGGYGLHLQTESIAKFGQLYLQKGQWQGRQIVPASWVEMATSRQVSNGSNPASDWEQGYGFQFWRARHNTYRGDGAFGQYCLVLPEHDAVVVITSGVKNMQATLNLVFDKLLPAFKEGPLPADAGGQAALKKTLAGLTLHAPQGQAQPGTGVTLGRKYVFPANPERIESVTLARAADGTTTLVTEVAGVAQRFEVPTGRWATSELPAPVQPFGQRVASSGAWTSGTTFAATVAYYATPFKTNVRLTFSGDTVTYEREMHVAFGETRQPVLVGKGS